MTKTETIVRHPITGLWFDGSAFLAEDIQNAKRFLVLDFEVFESQFRSIWNCDVITYGTKGLIN